MVSLPRHVAIILDGNGRWAKRRSLPRIFGHRAGMRKIFEVAQWARDFGIGHLSLFCFSTENWDRPKEEVRGLMTLIRVAARRLVRSEVLARVRWLGSEERLDPTIVGLLRDWEQRTDQVRDFQLNLAINYSSRDEVLRALDTIQADRGDRRNGRKIRDWDDFRSFLDTADIPDVDLLIRTSGELRLSNFLLLQSAYAELYFTPTLWPDFTADEFGRALEDFGRRERRFGRLEAGSGSVSSSGTAGEGK